MQTEKINIWEFGNKVYIKPKNKFLARINSEIHKKFGNKKNFYLKLKTEIPYGTFRNLLKYYYYKKGYYASLFTFLKICNKLKIPKENLQKNIDSYKIRGGYNIIYEPILPVKITPIFDMILAHNIADGTVINSKKNRQLYFGYRQFNKKFRIAYVKKLESIFGKIKYKKEYFNKKTRPYCPAVLSLVFFKYYNLNENSFLSKSARLPKKLLNKNNDHLLAVLIAFIIDEGNIDSSLISIRLKNKKLTEDLYKICKKLGYKSTLTKKGKYGNLYILRNGMKKFFADYIKLSKKYREINLYKMEKKIRNSFNIYSRKISRIKGNKKIIIRLIKSENLTVNQIAEKINMTRQGVRYHIHKLENENKIFRKGYIGRKNIVYSFVG